MTLLAVGLEVRRLGGQRAGRFVGAAVLFQQRQQGEQAHAAAGAGQEVAAGAGAFVMRHGMSICDSRRLDRLKTDNDSS